MCVVFVFGSQPSGCIAFSFRFLFLSFEFFALQCTNRKSIDLPLVVVVYFTCVKNFHFSRKAIVFTYSETNHHIMNEFGREKQTNKQTKKRHLMNVNYSMNGDVEKK